jgi:hypothetical protein
MKPIKCYSIALQIHNKAIEAGGSIRQSFKILSISIKYRIVGKTQLTEVGGIDSYSI